MEERHERIQANFNWSVGEEIVYISLGIITIAKIKKCGKEYIAEGLDTFKNLSFTSKNSAMEYVVKRIKEG